MITGGGSVTGRSGAGKPEPVAAAESPSLADECAEHWLESYPGYIQQANIRHTEITAMIGLYTRGGGGRVHRPVALVYLAAPGYA